MKTKLIAFAGAILAGIFIAGCGNATPKLSAQEQALFESSTPEIKQLFETALAADKAGNYLSACTNYQALLHQQLSVDQVMAMQTAMSSLTQRIYDADAKGDAGAKAAAEYLKASNSRQGR
jgi:hypothetical protein